MILTTIGILRAFMWAGPMFHCKETDKRQDRSFLRPLRLSAAIALTLLTASAAAVQAEVAGRRRRGRRGALAIAFGLFDASNSATATGGIGGNGGIGDDGFAGDIGGAGGNATAIALTVIANSAGLGEASATSTGGKGERDVRFQLHSHRWAWTGFAPSRT
jgi:hypothetical protein